MALTSGVERDLGSKNGSREFQSSADSSYESEM
jgi:hypothetical protein